MSVPSQAMRQVGVSTPLGDDVLVLRRMTAHEELGRLFEFRLEMQSDREDLDFDALLGQPMGVRLALPSGEDRHFHGICARISQGEVDRDAVIYHATLRPALWLLTRTADSRIFQDMTVPDIVKDRLRFWGLTDIEEHLNGSYRTWEYCVQYNETDFNFISRLLEQEGIYYYFKHHANRHVLVLADHYGAHEPWPDYKTVPFFPPSNALRRERDHISSWQTAREVQPGRYALSDFNFDTPQADLNVQSQRARDHGNADLPVYEVPGEYTTASEGEHYVRVRMEEAQARHVRAHGGGNARGLAAGWLFKLKGHTRADQDGEYLLTGVTHEVVSDTYTTGTAGGGTVYRNSFVCIPSAEPFRAARTTPKPTVQGPQTAIVVGKKGEEIWTDKYGRVKVQFHWDRYGNRDEQSSCWIRVGQLWAGPERGVMQVPRIGEEVIVDFLEGDPDRPLIVGRVYNADAMPPYPLPEHQARLVLRTRSTPNGASKNYNEIYLDDSKDQEEIHIHAERLLRTVVEANESHSVGASRTTTVYKTDTHTVQKGDHLIKLDEGSQTLTIVKGDRAAEIVKGGDKLSVPLGDIDQSAPAGTFTIDAKSVVIKGTADVTIVCGGSEIKLTPGMITIKGPVVKIN